MAVTQGDPKQAQALCDRMRAPFPCLADAQRATYKAFGLKRGSVWEVMGPAAIAHGFEAAAKGHFVERVVGDAFQMPGTFIIDRAGIVRYARYGDADLSGTVNLADFNLLAGNFGLTGKNWSDGDFDYDGSVGLADFNLLAGNFGLAASSRNGPTAQDWSALAAAVPEPAMGLAFAGVAASAAMSRRRRNA